MIKMLTKKGSIMKTIIIILALFAVVFFYFKSKDPWLEYKYKKENCTSLDLIRHYGGIPFSDNAKIEKIEFGKDTLEFEDEYMEAVLIIPISEIDNLFPESTRKYENITFFNINEGDIYFSIWRPSTVRKKNITIQRDVYFAVLKPEAGYSKVYFYVSSLGWK